MHILFIDCGCNKGQSLIEFAEYMKKINDNKKILIDSICIEPSQDKNILIPLKKQIKILKKENIYQRIKFFNLCINKSFSPIDFWDKKQRKNIKNLKEIAWEFFEIERKLNFRKKIKAILSLIKRIFFDKPIKVSSTPIDVFLPKMSDYSSYFLKLNIGGAEYTTFNDDNLRTLKENPPKKIFIKFHNLKCGKNYFETLNLFKNLENIAPLYYWPFDQGFYKEPIKITRDDIFNWYSKDISYMKHLSLRGKNSIFRRVIRKIFNIDITTSFFNKSLKSTYFIYPTKTKIKDIQKELLSQAENNSSLFGVIDRNLLEKEIKKLKNKFDKLKSNSEFVNNYSNEKQDISKFSEALHKKDILYSYLKDVSLVKEEILEINNIINKQIKNRGIKFLHLAGINLRASFSNQNKLAHTLKWHRDYNGWFILKAFIPLEIHSESFLEYIENTHRKIPYISYPFKMNKRTNKKIKNSISKSNIPLVNTSCLHRELAKNNYMETLICTYLAHPDYNSSNFTL